MITVVKASDLMIGDAVHMYNTYETVTSVARLPVRTYVNYGNGAEISYTNDACVSVSDARPGTWRLTQFRLIEIDHAPVERLSPRAKLADGRLRRMFELADFRLASSGCWISNEIVIGSILLHREILLHLEVARAILSSQGYTEEKKG